jgi:hypothetical protein
MFHFALQNKEIVSRNGTSEMRNLLGSVQENVEKKENIVVLLAPYRLC